MIKKVADLKTTRKELDKLDKDLLLILAERFKKIRLIGYYKKLNNIPVLQKKQELKKTKKLQKIARKLKIDDNVVKKIFNLIMKESRRQQLVLTKKPKIDKI